MTPRTKALLAWCDAVINHITDLPKIRAARAAFEAIDGKPVTVETCGEYVQPVPEEKPQAVIQPPAPVLPRQGMRRFEQKTSDTAKKKEKDPAKVAIGKRVRAARLQAGFGAQTRLAAVSGVPVSSINTIEAGATRPEVKTLSKLAAVLGVTIEWLQTGQGAPSIAAA